MYKYVQTCNCSLKRILGYTFNARIFVANDTHAMLMSTKKIIAKRQTFVEQAIRRMKYFRSLKFEIPLTLCQHAGR